jgi:hypothetical protein
MVYCNLEKYNLMNMYIMDISIGTYKLRVWILVLIIIVAWILFGHLLCSCCNITFKEGFEIAKAAVVNGMENRRNQAQGLGNTYNPLVSSTGFSTIPNIGPNDGRNVNPSIEGFVGNNNIANTPEFGGAKTPGYIMNPNTWAWPSLVYSPGTTPDKAVQEVWNRPKQQIPLPKGQLDMFATTEFKPECCPNTYSTSMGCACMTVGQYNYLIDRGGNNVPYSEY